MRKRAVELVRPRSRDHIHLTTDGAAVFGIENAPDDLHLRDRFHAHDLNLIVRAVIAHPAVLHAGLGVAAVDGHGAAPIADTVDAKSPAAPFGAIAGTHTGSQHHEV